MCLINTITVCEYLHLLPCDKERYSVA